MHACMLKFGDVCQMNDDKIIIFTRCGKDEYYSALGKEVVLK